MTLTDPEPSTSPVRSPDDMTRKWSWLPGWSSSMAGVPSVGGEFLMRQHTRDRCARLMSLLARPTTPPLWLGLVVAMSLIVVETTIDSAQKPHIVIGPSVPSCSGVLIGYARGVAVIAGLCWAATSCASLEVNSSNSAL